LAGYKTNPTHHLAGTLLFFQKILLKHWAYFWPTTGFTGLTLSTTIGCMA
jgi:hypothetical protein